MDNDITNNKRIAKNTFVLYLRTLVILVVSLYTSRVVLNTLGVEDYGIYNAVGGVVAMFTILSGALSNAISRYITYGIGKGEIERLKLIFCTSVNIQVVLAIIVFFTCEIVALWFLNNKMVIPQGRLEEANWVLHFSLLTFVVNLISVPYNACIIAHEHMNAYAYISIIDAILKLCVAFFLIISPIDKLMAYSLLLFITSLVVRLLYGLYCAKHFLECKYKLVYDRGLFTEMMRFAGWNFLGNATSILNSQGINILINLFFGVIANSARGIATQVESAVNQFVMTFSTAINPQITKSYAKGDKERMFYLVCKGAKFSYFLLLIFAIPLICEADTILTVWLINVPEETSLFMRLSLIGVMVTVLGNSGYNACIATGNIKKYSIVITLVGSLNFIFTWVAYKLGASVEITYVIYIGVYAIVQIVRLMLMKEMLEFPIMMFINEVFLKIVIPSISALVLPYLICNYFEQSIIRALLLCMLSAIWTIFCVFLFGLTKGERITVIKRIHTITLKKSLKSSKSNCINIII